MPDRFPSPFRYFNKTNPDPFTDQKSENGAPFGWSRCLTLPPPPLAPHTEGLLELFRADLFSIEPCKLLQLYKSF